MYIIGVVHVYTYIPPVVVQCTYTLPYMCIQACVHMHTNDMLPSVVVHVYNYVHVYPYTPCGSGIGGPEQYTCMSALFTLKL